MKKTPFTAGGFMSRGVFASSVALHAQQIEAANAPAEESVLLLSSISDDDEAILSAMEATADKNLRSFALALAIEWAKSGELEYESLESTIVGAVNDSDDEEDLDDDEMEEVDALLQAVAQVILDFTDLSESQVQTLFEDENDDVASEAADKLLVAIKAQAVDEVIANYAEKQAMLLSAVKKVVRDGKTVLIKKRTKKHRMSPAQKAALKKAQRKAHGSAARASRKKSNRLRKSKGM